MDRDYTRMGTLTDRKAYDFFKKNRKRKCKGINQYNLFVKAVSGIFYEIKRQLVNSEGGVYIEGVGYFCNILSKPKVRKIRSPKKLADFKKDHYYFPVFFPIDRFKMWSMDYTFSFHTEKAIRWNKRYKCHLSIIKSLQNKKQMQRRG